MVRARWAIGNAGIAAACGQHWDAAQAHYETALTQAHDLAHKIAQAEKSPYRYHTSGKYYVVRGATSTEIAVLAFPAIAST